MGIVSLLTWPPKWNGKMEYRRTPRIKLIIGSESARGVYI